ncbi:hypothetical protein [Streptomyces sp. CC208A]|uniref:hypothetical protein n=1 Tax=Streptomyces sp. CC208A TaxID=3044573 RepID=UPI0024A9E3FD|nr:hypothetical protein [Streptomyces sp. CC208A]
MTVGWTVLLAIAVPVIGLVGWGFARGVLRGAVQSAREQVRRDLIALGQSRAVVETLAHKTGEVAVAFAAPGADGREYMIGWLWWRAALDPNGSVEHTTGWALTYRRARRAAGLPTTMKARHPEFIITRAAERRVSRGGR